MKKVATAVSLACATLGAHAQGSATIYGLLDEGFTYVTNEQGSHNYKLDNSILYPSLFGIKGSEELGGGTKAIFNLVSQFNLGTGASMPAGSIFGRNAYLGLTNDRYGTVTFGNQYDFMTDTLFYGGYDASYAYGGLYNLRQGPFAKLGVPQNPTGAFEFDNVGGAHRVQNSVKYVTPNLAGFSAGAMYGFGGVAGSLQADRTVGFSASYTAGAISVGGAYVDAHYPELANGREGIRNYGFGARYDGLGNRYNVLFTDTKNTLTGGEVWVVQAGIMRWFNDAWLIGTNYQYMKGNAKVSHNKASQVTAAVQYLLSKRTTVYLEGVFQQAGGDGPAYAWINGLSPSGSNRQTALRVGLATRF
ncbi:porin [Paraburkholderia guartelaensis]|uniref:Porin n=1 Tax=Paraburkholderia guartelaensis TaxID=2546446 RepID=A0ABU9SAW3_9BURK